MSKESENIVRQWEEMKDMKNNENAILKVFAKLERRKKPKAKQKEKGKNK